MKMVQVSKEFVCLENVVKMFLALLLETFVYPEQYLELVQTVNVLMIQSLPFLNVEFLHCLQNQQILVSKSHRLCDSLYYVPLKTISILDWKQTVVCNTTRDCQDFGVRAECSKVHGGTYDNTGTEHEGWCTPVSCRVGSGCPDIGDVCTDGLISGSCRVEGKCVYEEVKLQAMCTPDPPVIARGTYKISNLSIY